MAGNEQTTYSNYNVSSAKPSIPMTEAPLSGWVANSMNGGHNKVLHYEPVMANTFIKQRYLNINIKLLTPKTPTFQPLRITFDTYWVPNSAVWKNARKFKSQKGGATNETKIEKVPNFEGFAYPNMNYRREGEDYEFPIIYTTHWRDSWISSYLSVIGRNTSSLENNGERINIQPVSALPARGFVSIYNRYLRNKMYDQEIPEYLDDDVTSQELENYFRSESFDLDYYYARAKRNDSYFTDYRTEAQGFALAAPTVDQFVELTEWASWESKINEARTQPENQNLTDEEVIAKISGGKLLTEGTTILIGRKTYMLNYSTITQSSYNTNPDVSEEFQTMGTQGAYSYTELNVPLFAGKKFDEDGYIHVIAHVHADTVFESAINRKELNINALDMYRPDLKDDKLDVLYICEMGTDRSVADLNNPEFYKEVVGFKRRFSEYFKLNNVIGGDMLSQNWKAVEPDGSANWNDDGRVITQKTYQFFENDAATSIIENTNEFNKDIWLDYTDLQINKNQAILNQIYYGSTGKLNKSGIAVGGQNQIFYIGKVLDIERMPIDKDIQNNFTKWGEH